MNSCNVLLKENQIHYIKIVRAKDKFRNKHVFINAYFWKSTHTYN